MENNKSLLNQIFGIFGDVPWTKAILELFFSTGLRLSELCALNREQVYPDKSEFTIVGKGGKARLVFISDQAKFWLKQYLALRKDSNPALFIRLKGKNNERLGSRTVQRLVSERAQKAETPMNVTTHMLRHAFACDLLANGANLRLVQELLGHKNLATTQIYTHLTNLELKEGYFKFHSS